MLAVSEAPHISCALIRTDRYPHRDAFIASYNETARPFAWSKSEGHQRRFKLRFADL